MPPLIIIDILEHGNPDYLGASTSRELRLLLN
jgi:hypothetical protein